MGLGSGLATRESGCEAGHRFQEAVGTISSAQSWAREAESPT